MITSKNWFIALLFVCLSVAGCATMPSERVQFPYPVVSLNNQSYFSLTGLCEKEGLSWEYDPLSKILILKKDRKEFKFLVGSRLAMIGDETKEFSAPLEIKDSVVYAPLEVRDEIIPPACKIPESVVAGPLHLKPIRSVVIDAGHGGKDPGAIGRYGLKEKDVVLDMSQRVGNELKRCGVKVYFTRSTDVFIPLPQRSDIANGKEADVFVSIHANACRSRRIEGFEVYYLTEAVDDDARALAAAENAPLGLDEGSLHSRVLTLKAMLWDMIYTENRKESIELAHFISKSVSGKLDLKTLGIRGAPFAVLKGTRMPAVLVEIGYISNREGEKKLRSEQYRQVLARAIAEGIMGFKNYCEGRK